MSQNPNYKDPPPAYTQYATVHQPLSTIPPNCPTYGSTYGSTSITPSTTVIIQPTPIHSDTIFLVGGCPACRIGVLEQEFTFLGIMLCLLFFPLGILCCLALQQRRCLNCGAVF